MKNLVVVITYALSLISLVSHASSTQIRDDSPFTNCQLPTVNERGPIHAPLYVVGTFPEGQWIHQDNRKMSYKGNGIYQLVMDEKPGNFSVQFATMSWKPQFTADGLVLKVGEVNELKRAGFAKNTAITFSTAGRYVWTVKISDDRKPQQVAVALCH
ncbi:TPA: glycosidase [Klebsiella pneumoniae]|nr:glycosidase [Klebsiella pneumoniae]HBT5023673.1 glycosidase [Klebsiella pneumoniae]HBT5164060.1 glycosidase [Klebsiella pneumoniae]HBW3466258.1 glycosidase [Klebsiella pneumoniae]HBW8614682.1 glycosidase [Klebsiella pneumoniae]